MTDLSVTADYAVKAATGDLARAQTAYEETLASIDAARADVLTDEKISRLDAALDDVKARLDALSRAAQRPLLATAASRSDRSRKADFIHGYLRQGQEPGLDRKAMTVGTAAEGGFAVPQEIDAMIETRLRDASPIRRLAQVVQVGSSGYRKLVANGNLASGWVAETAARPETAATTFTEIVPPSGDLYASPAVTQMMLDDAMFDVESWLAEEIARDFAQKEGAAFVSGNGTAKPKGFLSYTTAVTADAARTFGQLQYVASGAAGAFATTNPADRLIDLVHALRAPYRQGATFVMNSKTLSVVRKFKTGDGAFLWQPSLQLGVAATLLGYPVVEAEDMPDIAADSFSIAFGNFASGYVIADRAGVRLLRDPYSNKPYVNFYATKRTGGAVTNSDCIKLMKFAVS